MSTRAERLIVAGAFVVGFVCLPVGFTVLVTLSESVGQIVLAVGGALMLGTRGWARLRRLPAPSPRQTS